MTKSKNENVGMALHQLNLGLAPMVENELKQKYGTDWANVISRCVPNQGRNRREASLNDPQVTLSVVCEEWDRVFRHRLKPSDRNLVYELRAVRNGWAHHEVFSTTDTLRAIDSVVRLLDSIKAKELDAVQQLQKSVLIELAQELLPQPVNAVATSAPAISLAQTQDEDEEPVALALQQLLQGVDAAIRRTNRATVDKAYNLARQVEAESQATLHEFRESLDQQVRTGKQLSEHLATLTASCLQLEAASVDSHRDMAAVQQRINEQGLQLSRSSSQFDTRVSELQVAVQRSATVAEGTENRLHVFEARLKQFDERQHHVDAQLQLQQKSAASTEARLEQVSMTLTSHQAASCQSQQQNQLELEALRSDYDRQLQNTASDRAQLIEALSQNQGRLHTLSNLCEELQARSCELDKRLQELESQTWRARFTGLRNAWSHYAGRVSAFVQDWATHCRHFVGGLR